jgi:hypothetical protein
LILESRHGFTNLAIAMNIEASGSYFSACPWEGVYLAAQ